MPKKKSKKKIIIAVVIIAVLLLIIGFVKITRSLSSAVASASDYQLLNPVEKRELSDEMIISGTVQGNSSSNVTSLASAEITDVCVSLGDAVKKGDVICTLDSTDIDNQIASLEQSISVNESLNEISDKENQTTLNNTKEDNALSLKSAKSDYNDAKTEYKTAKKKLATDKATLKEKEATLASVTVTYNDAKSKYDAADTALDAATDANNDAEINLTKVKNSLEENPDDEKLIASAAELQKKYNETSANLTKASAALSKAQKAYTKPSEDYQTAKAEKETAEADVKADEETVKSLKKAYIAAKDAYDLAKTNAKRSQDSVELSIEKSSYQVDDNSEETALSKLKAQKSDCTVYAPCDGVVTALNVHTGDMYSAGSTMMTIEDTSKMKILATVSEEKILKIKEGLEATVTSTALPDKEISGQVTRVVYVSNSASYSSYSSSDSGAGYSVEITIDDNELLVGMTAKASIIITKRDDAIAVPYDLVQEDESGNYVITADDNGDGTYTSKKTYFEAGEEVDYYTVVNGGDLKEGDLLVYDSSVGEGETFSGSVEYPVVEEE